MRVTQPSTPAAPVKIKTAESSIADNEEQEYAARMRNPALGAGLEMVAANSQIFIIGRQKIHQFTAWYYQKNVFVCQNLRS